MTEGNNLFDYMFPNKSEAKSGIAWDYLELINIAQILHIRPDKREEYEKHKRGLLNDNLSK